MEDLGDKLKRLRIEKCYTLRHVENETGISNAYLSQLENKKIRKPSGNVLYKLAGLYGVSVDELLITSKPVNVLIPDRYDQLEKEFKILKEGVDNLNRRLVEMEQEIRSSKSISL